MTTNQLTAQVSDNKKLQLIRYIYYLEDKLIEGSLFWRELQSMKRRYIYKDISKAEYIDDKEYLKQLRDYILEYT